MAVDSTVIYGPSRTDTTGVYGPSQSDTTGIYGPSRGGAFVPTDITGCQLWLPSDLAAFTDVGGKASAWLDASGNSRNVAQGTDANRMTISASAINGKPGLISTAATYMLNVLADLFASGSARTIFVVCDVGTVGGPVFGVRTGGVSNTYFLTRPAYASFAGGVHTDSTDGSHNATMPLPTALPHIVEFSSAAAPALLSVKVDGVSQVVTQSAAMIAETGSTGFSVGYWQVLPAESFTGKFCEIVVYDSDLSEGDRLPLRTQMATDFGITI